MSKSEQIAIQKERHRLAKERVRSEQQRHRQVSLHLSNVSFLH